MSNSLDPDGPDMGPKCLQRLSAWGQLSIFFFGVKLQLFTYPSIKNVFWVLKKNRLIETIL